MHTEKLDPEWPPLNVFLYFFALITEEGFLISPCYSLDVEAALTLPVLEESPEQWNSRETHSREC